MQDYLKELNEFQRKAVVQTEGPVMIVAGAGSGKTKALTTRIAHIMNLGEDAFRILALTFTNKAAAEMKERVDLILGDNEARNLYIGTFHSVFSRILRREAERLGYTSSFTIYDSDDAKKLVRTIVKDFNLDEKVYKANIVSNRISSAKNALIFPLDYLQNKHIEQEDYRAKKPMIGQIYKEYVRRCFQNNAMDFDDLLIQMYELLTKHPDRLAYYQERFKYIMVDEYQDTNTAQYKIIHLLADKHQNICVVGDDAQSIYSFRGATIENILKFQDDYPNAKVIKLEQNYRSTKNIIQVANQIIGKNKHQIPKNLWTENSQGELIKLVRTRTDNDEGRFVADAIKEQKLRNHFENKDFAILYRTNAQSRSFEESLRRAGIPYKIYGGLSFYQRKEVKDLIAYLRAVVNPRDEEALKRIINYPARGIGNITMDRLGLYAMQNNLSFGEVIQNPEFAGVRGAAVQNIKNFALMISYFREAMQHKNAYEIAFEVGKQSGLVKLLYEDKTPEGQARYENVQELLNSIKEYVESPNEDGEVEEDKSLSTYLQNITLLTDQDDDDENQDVVKLMTIHASKGLEFPNVFAVGVEETIFPSAMSVYDREGLEEERRLFYVVVTRAEKNLWITYANNRYRFGNLVSNEPSRFIAEIPPEYLDFSLVGGGTGFNHSRENQDNFFSEKYTSYSRNQSSNTYKPKRKSTQYYNEKPQSSTTSTLKKQILEKKKNETFNHVLTEDFTPSDPDAIQVGHRVEHVKFGFGTVEYIDEGSQNKIATVIFEKAGSRRLMLAFAKLMIHN